MRHAGRSATLIMGPWSHANQQHVIGDVNFGFGANSAFMGMPGPLHGLQLDSPDPAPRPQPPPGPRAPNPPTTSRAPRTTPEKPRA
ncbi:hypothetical protein [Streptomyces sp. NPDC006132]|uniref:hypothetical protein n=1 Tax=Streptomyces sp. NPDC006132 TaxID=3156732 RepID=UPI0033F06CAD